MSVKWTPEQQKAIDIRGGDVLVSAAAGSGKTAVLVERVIRRITDTESPVDIDRLLICTFTNAAASGMQIKLREALRKQLEQQPDNAHLAKQLALFPRAAINTVHAFCQALLKNYFHKVGLSAAFEIGDETQLGVLRKQALEQVLTLRYENPSADFEALVASFGGKRDDSGLSELAMRIYGFSQSTADPGGWLSAARDMYSGGGVDIWSSYLSAAVAVEFSGMAAAYDSAISVIETADGIAQYIDCFGVEREMLASLAGEQDLSWDDMRQRLDGIVFGTLPRKSKGADDNAVAYVQGIRKKVKTQIDKIRNMYSCTQQEAEQDCRILGGVIGEFCRIVSDFAAAYAELKADKGIVDFNDLEHLTLKLLSDEEVRTGIQGKFDEVLVDEYQDTNGVQEAIFSAVSGGDNLFMVGDVKQSIYGFRNAQPQIFTVKAFGFTAKKACGSLISLSHNFRSGGSVIDFVNAIFLPIMTQAMGGVDYENGHSLIKGRADDAVGATEIHIIEKTLEAHDDLTEDEQLSDEILREAMFTAQRIVTLVETERPLVTDEDSGLPRPIQYRDIAVLTRKIKGVSSVFAQELTRLNIPFYCEDDRGDYIISLEISTIIAFLQIIDNPLQDIPLLTVMRSPMFHFTDEELAKIRAAATGAFYLALCCADDEKSKAFVRTLEHYRSLSRHERIEHLIRKILSDTGYLSFVALLPGGEARVTNLRLLCERAGRFESGEYKSIFDFIGYITAMRENAQSYSAAKIAGQNDNVVKMMSIHKSKGLEFPAVFVVRCGGRFNITDLNAPVLYDLDLGIGCDFIDINRGIKYPSVSKYAVSAKKRFAMLSEEMRVLYVAMTRAKDYLFMVGSCNNAEKKLDEWENAEITPYTVSKQSTFLDWIGLALGGKIRSAATVHSAFDIVMRSREGIETPVEDEDPMTDGYSDEVARRLEYRYPYASTKGIPSKLPVSQAILDAQQPIRLKKPEFMQKREALSAAVRGTVIHFVLQNIDIARTAAKYDIERQLSEMVTDNMIDARLADVVSADAIAEFFASGIGRRLRASGMVRREVKFFVDVPAKEIIDGLDENAAEEKILLQGVVDCCFEEDGELVIIDYKTGSVDRPEYQKQLNFYARGLSASLNMPVKETLLYPLI